jgi:hypothetical protein
VLEMRYKNFPQLVAGCFKVGFVDMICIHNVCIYLYL